MTMPNELYEELHEVGVSVVSYWSIFDQLPEIYGESCELPL